MEQLTGRYAVLEAGSHSTWDYGETGSMASG